MIKLKNPINVLAAFGLALGALFGMAGTFVPDAHVQALLWALDGSGLVMAAALLALKYFRKEQDLVAAGFLVFAIAEAVILSSNASGLAANAVSLAAGRDLLTANAPAFAAGMALWAVALLLISLAGHFALAVRLLGLVSAILFAVTAVAIFWGEPLLPTSSPLPFYAYPFLVLTFFGWIWSLLREGA